MEEEEEEDEDEDDYESLDSDSEDEVSDEAEELLMQNDSKDLRKSMKICCALCISPKKA